MTQSSNWSASTQQTKIKLSSHLGILLGHVDHQVHHTLGVAPLVVIPGHNLAELGVEGDTGLSIEDGGAGVRHEVLGHTRLIAVAEDASHVALRAGLHSGADVLVRGLLLEDSSQIHHRHIRGGHTEGHTGQLTLQVGHDLGQGLGGTSGGRNDVGRRATATTPVLATLGGTIHHKLGGSHGVDSGHQTHLNAKGIINALDQRAKTVGGAGSARHELHVSGVGVLVDAHHDGRGVILGGSREDDLLGTIGKMRSALLGGEKSTSGLADVISTELAPPDGPRVTGVHGGHQAAINDETVISDLNSARVTAVDGVVLQLVSHVVVGGTRVDHLEVGLRVGDQRTGDEATNTAKTVDTGVDGHGGGLVGGGSAHEGEGKGHGLRHVGSG
mmetsp:Transcript_21568/g.36986  ORF Transcript_21568/g.36986 Transcript_21568/m.36986 type:complete len:386 (+) Transcript_21568:167-1324(+)